MTKSPELITRDLPRWIANHGFDQNPLFYSESVRKQAFQYLASFATESVLKNALSIFEKNEHYKRDSTVRCCHSQVPFPHDLSSKLNDLLELVRDRNALINTFLPKILVEMVLDYLRGSTD